MAIPVTQDDGVTFNRACSGFVRIVDEVTGEIVGPVAMTAWGATISSDPSPIGDVPVTQVTLTITYTLTRTANGTNPFRYEFAWAIYEVYQPSDIQYNWVSWVGSHPSGGASNRGGDYNGKPSPYGTNKPPSKLQQVNPDTCCGGDPESGDPSAPDFPITPTIKPLTADTTAMASPQMAINPVSGNMVARDVPIWWDSPYGLDVHFTLNFNSQDSLNTIHPFGPGWVLNFCAYILEDTAGNVTVVAGNGDRWVFTPDGSGGYVAPLDLPSTLVKTAANSFNLTYLGRNIVHSFGQPSGVSTSVSLLLSVTDQWGVSLTLGHNSNGALTSVTHSIGGTWNLIYNTAGLVERIDDPFGRSAYFAYDTPGALREVTDMGGLNYAFRYSTSANPVNATTASQMFLTEVVYAPEELATASQPNRTWYPLTFRFLTEPPDGSAFGLNNGFRITTSQLYGGSQVVSYDGSAVGSYRSAAQVAAGSSGTSYTYTLANGENRIAGVTYPDGGTRQPRHHADVCEQWL